MAPPKILLPKPEPVSKQRLYHGRTLTVWEGKVSVNDVQGWVDNPRITLHIKSLRHEKGRSALNQDEIFEIMKREKEMDIKGLSHNISENGLREPITLCPDGKLLDGNRRFFAIRYLLEGMKKTDPRRQDYEDIPAFVLNDPTSKDEEHVLVEENFSPSLKKEWPEYVKALRIKEEEKSGLEPEEIAEKYQWDKRKVQETLRTMGIIDEFLTVVTEPENPEDDTGGGLGISENEAEIIASKKYQFFNEAQKSLRNDLGADVPFKINFFKWIVGEKFKSFNEVRIAYKAWKDPEARSLLVRNDPSAAKEAKAIIDYKQRVLETEQEAASRVENFIKFLRELTTEEINALPREAVDALEEVLKKVISMAKSVRTDGSNAKSND